MSLISSASASVLACHSVGYEGSTVCTLYMYNVTLYGCIGIPFDWSVVPSEDWYSSSEHGIYYII